jgi:hypothetical protein
VASVTTVQQFQLRSNSERLDFVQLLTTPKGAKVVTRWIMELHRLPQFDLALSLVQRSPLEISEHYRQRKNIEFY